MLPFIGLDQACLLLALLRQASHWPYKAGSMLLEYARPGPDLDWTWTGPGPDLGPGMGPGPELDNFFITSTGLNPLMCLRACRASQSYLSIRYTTTQVVDLQHCTQSGEITDFKN